MSKKKPIWRKKIKSAHGVIVLITAALVGGFFVLLNFSEPKMAATPSVRSGKVLGQTFKANPCQVGKVCLGPKITAEDPELDEIIYRFIDQATGELAAAPITAKSGQSIIPQFRFDEPGVKRLYLEIEDTGGHSASTSQVIVPVE